MTVPAKTGIAIITYNRPSHLRQCLESVLEFTQAYPRAQVAVFDDYSDYDIDNTVQDRCPVKKSRSNLGVVCTKNRALFYFAKTIKTRNIILLEDDMIVTSKQWLPTWEEACKIHGHINYTAPWFFSKELKQYFQGGSGSPDDPHQFGIVTGQCSAVRRSLVRNTVGYLNPRFKGYGYVHVEWTDRLISLGHGGSVVPGRKTYFSINEGIAPLRSESLKDPHELRANHQTFKDITSDPNNQFISRPWLNRMERRVFLHDQEDAVSTPSATS
jgi:glycosyltransferase involved in cell wall biosynthesis